MTTNELIVELIKFALILAAAVAAVWKGADAVISINEKKVQIAKEKSVGESKIKEIEAGEKVMRDDTNNLKRTVSSHVNEIKNLKRDYDNLMNRIWDFLKK